MARTCPTCRQSFTDRVDFCFADGTPLAVASSGPTPPPVIRRAVAPAPPLTGAARSDPRVWWVSGLGAALLAAWLLA